MWAIQAVPGLPTGPPRSRTPDSGPARVRTAPRDHGQHPRVAKPPQARRDVVVTTEEYLVPGRGPENDGWTFGYYTVGGIYPDPCTRASGTFDHEGSTFPDIWVEALEAQRRTTTSGAVPVTLDGYDGIYLELTGPKNPDFGTCRGDRLTIFGTTAKGKNHWIVQSGVVDRFWILDVDGQRIVLTGQVSPETTDSQYDQLTEMVKSVQFERS